MKHIFKYIILLSLLLLTSNLLAQKNAKTNSTKEEMLFVVRGSVLESETHKPITNVQVFVNGGVYTTTSLSGDFKIQVKKGDELTFAHKDIKTVYYTIKDDESITVEVIPAIETEAVYKRKNSLNSFNSIIDSATVYLKKDAEKSILFITEALSQSNSRKQNAQAYEILADVYVHWKQYDLAISNYKISLQNNTLNEVILKLANAYFKNNDYQESLQTYKSIKVNTLSNYQKTEFHEGLGDVYKKIVQLDLAITNYKKALEIAEKHLIKPKITDLNSKIGDAYNASGKLNEANSYFENALDLASQENKKRAVTEKVKVADFQNENMAYEDEIQLRKEAIEEISELETDTLIDNESALTLQKQNYKIGNAYYQQKDYANAVPYLEKSIAEADSKEDLLVKKDAIRKLSETYRDAGDYTKALETYKAYQEAVDTLYVKMDQEIAQAKRFNKSIAEKQNRISSLESDRALNQSNYQLSVEQSKRQKLIIYSLFGGLVLLLITAYLMYKYIKQQKLANNLLALKSLRSQMNPHFIFNALNSVNSFIATNDERTANRYLSDFSQLMRAVLENSEQDFIPLQKEVELLELYTQLEHFRFKEKFDYTIHVDENVAINAFQIPPMLLQPYIENAVWHGLRYKEEKGKLEITISQQNTDELTISIIDDGIGREKSKALKTENQKKQNSKGMNNIKKRVAILNEMYKDKVDVFINDFKTEGDKGTKVVVTLKKD
ncbi:histidine kinase [Oceanihabitans sp. 2_MG-2023]|uniref:tetratricopeptide repeat-containing sensor histidine kinase n=1 Tax=Oceanihabitans sp. 2_MG-2023 TaxID=3062661 RepID=UPI0026E3ED33|nr:histidine kinase [Oceanihabitans sp. 2_MG-2023]MDO6596329.1 histidine kinase [Oceanihabitans sp. 2_MG-2023]